MRFIDSVHIHESQQVIGKLAYGERGLATGRLPMPAGIDSDDTEVP